MVFLKQWVSCFDKSDIYGFISKFGYIGKKATENNNNNNIKTRNKKKRDRENRIAHIRSGMIDRLALK